MTATLGSRIDGDDDTADDAVVTVTGGRSPGDRRFMLPVWLAVPIAAAGGALLSTAFPSLSLWFLAVPAVAVIFWALDGRSVGGAFLTGTVGGFAFYGVHTLWLTTYLGPVPWLALAGLQAIFFGIGAVLIALAWRLVPRSLPSRWWASMVVLPAVLAALWLLREAVASVWPYGGFSWGRLAFSQSESPLGSLTAFLGASGLSFVVALIAALLLQAVRTVNIRSVPRVAPIAVTLIVAFAMPAWPVQIDGTLRVAAVQGNADAGLFADRQRGDILDDHLQATMPVIDSAPDIDLVVWPENASDLNPLRYPRAAGVLDYVTEKLDAPLVVGAITDGVEDTTYNSMLLWESGEGSVAQYDKKHPVPFAEYLPDREFWYPFAPSLFDLVPRDFSFGQRPNVFDIDGILAGVAICFDIVDDALLREMADGGAQLILAPTNNADFGRSDESIQQLAIARLRAIEYGRSVVNISTVGTSAIIAPDGSTIAALTTFEPGAMVEDVPLSTSVTPAAVIGLALEIGLASLGFIALLGAGATTMLQRRRASRA